METAQTQKEQMEVAQMRFGIIAPLVQGTYTDASMAAYCRRVALTPQRLPDGRVFQYKPKTVAKWYQLYEKGSTDPDGNGCCPELVSGGDTLPW